MESKNITQLKRGHVAAVCPAVMPDGTPAPFVLTPAEAIKFLRLDDTEHPENTLTYYHDKGLLRATYIGKRRFYTINELCDFAERVTRQNRKTEP